MKPMRIATQSNKVSWTVAAATGLEWAKKVFQMCGERWRSSGSPVGSNLQDLPESMRKIQSRLGKEHAATLKSKADTLNKEQFSALHYTAPGTDLTSWLCRKTTSGNLPEPSTAQGESFLPNMPTEEVFTAPDFRRAEGYVTSTKPL